MLKHLVYPRGPAPAGTPVLWRCEAKRYAVCVDPDGDVYGSTPPRLEMWWWSIDRATPKGAWVAGRFVLLTATKRWACPTEQEALESFMARKKKQIRILSHRLAEAEADLALAYPKTSALVLA